MELTLAEVIAELKNHLHPSIVECLTTEHFYTTEYTTFVSHVLEAKINNRQVYIYLKAYKKHPYIAITFEYKTGV